MKPQWDFQWQEQSKICWLHHLKNTYFQSNFIMYSVVTFPFSQIILQIPVSEHSHFFDCFTSKFNFLSNLQNSLQKILLEVNFVISVLYEYFLTFFKSLFISSPSMKMYRSFFASFLRFPFFSFYSYEISKAPIILRRR